VKNCEDLLSLSAPLRLESFSKQILDAGAEALTIEFLREHLSFANIRRRLVENAIAKTTS
jgi:hypothetical protein